MKKLILALLLTTIAACNEPQAYGDITKIHVVGDSLAAFAFDPMTTYSWPKIIDLSHDAVAGRSPYEHDIVIPETELLIISLGSNDRLRHTEDQFRAAYQILLDQASGDVLCILPNFEREARVITELCANTLQSVPADHTDGLHYTAAAQQAMSDLVLNWLIDNGYKYN